MYLCIVWYSIEIESMLFIYIFKGFMMYVGFIEFFIVIFIYGIFVSMKYVFFVW